MTTLQPVRLVLDCPELTPRQRDVFKEIIRFTRWLGYPPTIRDLMRCFGFRSTNGMTCHLVALRKKGFVKESDGKCRTIAINTERLRWREVT